MDVVENVSDADKQERLNAFVKEYGELVVKHQVDFAPYPVFSADGTGGFKISVQTIPVDISQQAPKDGLIEQA